MSTMISHTSVPRRARIAATGLYHPERLVPNQWFNDRYKMDIDTFLKEKRNIHQRYWMNASQATSDLILPAAQKAMKNAGITVDDIDMIIVATDTPDYLSPSTAAVVQYKLGAKRAGTFDINAACAGFVTALDVGSKFIIADGQYRNILVVGAYGMSKYLNFDDYKIASLFADGAAAAILQPTTEPGIGILASQFHTEGQYHDYMGIYAGGTYMPMTHEVIDRNDHLLNFAKKIPLETNSTHWPRLINVLLDRVGANVSDISRFFLTQINIQTIEATMDALKVDRKLSHNIMDRFGYTGSAAIGMALADADEKNLLKKGDLIMFVGSGGGVSMASIAARWG